MPAKSEEQAGAARMALAAKRGRLPVRRLGPAARSMYDSMSLEELRKFSHTSKKKRKG